MVHDAGRRRNEVISLDRDQERASPSQTLKNKNKLFWRTVQVMALLAALTTVVVLAVVLTRSAPSSVAHTPNGSDTIPGAHVPNGGNTISALESRVSNSYLNNADLNTLLTQVSMKCKGVAQLHTIGKSHAGVDMKMLEISNTPGFSDNTRIRIGLLANMHGNEANGRVFMSWFVNHFCSNVQSDTMQRLLNRTVIYVIPSINPDGFETRLQKEYRDSGTFDTTMYTYGRYAMANGIQIDLNRDFPDVTAAYLENHDLAFNRSYFKSSKFQSQYSQNSNARESRVMQAFFDSYPLDFALNFHDGAQVVSYPLDLAAAGTKGWGVYSESPDDTLYRSLSYKYADSWGDKTSMCAREIAWDGVTNGAHWFSLNGGMQDFSYLVYGTVHITIEMKCEKFPSETSLPTMIQQNRHSLFAYLTAVSDGSYPKAYAESSPFPNQRIHFVSKSDPSITASTVSDDRGAFTKILPAAGQYDILVSGVSRATVNFQRYSERLSF